MDKLTNNIRVKVDDDLRSKYEAKAKERHVSMSDIIREAMYEYAYKYGLQAPYKAKVKHANK